MTVVSERQILANVRNSKKSTGPRTSDGRKISSQNAIRHGLFSRETLIPGDNPAELECLRRALHNELNPIGTLEEVIVDQIISLTWRLIRVTRIESGMFFPELSGLGVQHSLTDIKEIFDSVLAGSMPGLGGMPAQESESSAPPRVAFAFLEGVRRNDAISRLSRYEVGLDRMRARQLNHLARLQAARRGEYVQPPVSLDITVDDR